MDRVRVLVVEDDDAIGNALLAVLGAARYEVTRTASGAATLAAVEDAQPDVLLLDLGLPDMDGVDLCRRLRRGCPDLAIVVVTARDDEMDVVLGLNAGADDYITKPFRLGELQARLAAVLRRAAPPPRPALARGGGEVDPPAPTPRRGRTGVGLRPRE